MKKIGPLSSIDPHPLPFLGALVPAGFPSPAEDWIEGSLDLNQLLVTNPPSTFLMRATGDSMRDIGILDGSVLVVDRSIDPKSGCIVVAVVDGGLTVKMFTRNGGRPRLQPANPDFPDILLDENSEVWGVVTAAIQRF